MTEVEFLAHGFQTVEVSHTGSGGAVLVTEGPVLVGAVKATAGTATLYDDASEAWAPTAGETFNSPIRINGPLNVDASVAATVWIAYKRVP